MFDLPIYVRNLRFLRQIRGDTQKDVADILGKNSKQAITVLESGKVGMEVNDLIKLADHFNITETELLRHQFWRMSDEEIAALKTRWGETTKTKVLENV